MKRVTSYFAALVFLLTCLFPPQIALALSDCGPHQVVSCETHDDEHFVATHTQSVPDFKKSAPKNYKDDFNLPAQEHDAAHQIEKGKLSVTTVAVTSLEVFEIYYTAPECVVSVVSDTRLQKSNWGNGPPSHKSSFLHFLPSIRLQV